MEKFPHTLRITRPSANGVQGDDGAWAPAAATTLYDDGADLQDAGETEQRMDDGTPVRDSDGRAFLEVTTAIRTFRPGDDAVGTWEDASTATGKVRGTRRIDGVVFIEWIRRT